MMLVQLKYEDGKLSLLNYNSLERLNIFNTEYHDGYIVYQVYALNDTDNVPKRYVLLHQLREAKDYIIVITPTLAYVDEYNTSHYEYEKSMHSFIDEYQQHFSNFSAYVDSMDKEQL